MNVLLIGGGGREHALAWAIAKSPKLTTLFCAPGNAGIAEAATCCDLDTADHDAVLAFCETEDIGLVVVGPEAPLVEGLSDHLRQHSIPVFGPSAAAAQLEGSKGFTKDLCKEADIPTAAYGRFDEITDAKLYLAGQPIPVVIKADGLAAGKGVIIATERTEAEDALDMCFEGTFGEAGSQVVIEEFLTGEEASFFVITDGEHIVPFGTAQDHKRAFDGDEGPNTGGMGAYSPAPILSDALVEQTMERIIRPTVETMAKRGTPFQGVLYAGLMITDTGPQLIEYNVRFGDPECQVLMMRLKSDMLELLHATATGTLETITPQWHDDVALTVVMASKGYPGSYTKGTAIDGLAEAATEPDVTIFHAGTSEGGRSVIATGGRVLNVTALGKTVSQARDRAYAAIDKIDWPEGFYRNDIGWRAIEREKQSGEAAE